MRLCLYVAGEPSAAIAAEHGLYPAWFDQLAAGLGVTLEPLDAREGRLPAGFDTFDGIVITGSPASLTAPEPWMEAGVELVRQCYASQTPLLGVCFGHQLIGAAFGGGVITNPRGWELSTYPIELTEAGRHDPLFDGLPDRFDVNFSHQDIVDGDTLSPLNGVQVLAGNPTSAVQALAAGPAIRGVQFHPEFTGTITRAHVRAKADVLAADAERRGDPDGDPERRLERARDCPAGRRVFENFVTHLVRA